MDAYRSLEGEDMTLCVAYKSGEHYYVKDEDGRLGAARHMGRAFILAEVCELVSCTATRK
jgi:hypothetical protein